MAARPEPDSRRAAPLAGLLAAGRPVVSGRWKDLDTADLEGRDAVGAEPEPPGRRDPAASGSAGAR